MDKLIADFKAATESPNTTQSNLYNHLKGLQPWLASLPAASCAAHVATNTIGSRALLFVWNRSMEKARVFYQHFRLVELFGL